MSEIPPVGRLLELGSCCCLAAAALAALLLVIQLLSLARHLRAPPPRSAVLPAISILKPLCGLDDDLATLLDDFALLDYSSYEVLLGVRTTADAAWPVACEAARRHPGRLRVVVQGSEPGLNPKVNQLITLARRARHDLLVVSDSNVSVGGAYLREIAAYLSDPTVGIVTHPIAGVGEQSLGALLDNVQMSAGTALGMVAAARLAAKPIVVGKSMALRREDLLALGGFEAVKDVLAEDYVLGLLVTRRLGKRAVVARSPIFSVARHRNVGAFLARYRRWSVIHRHMVGIVPYLAEVLLYPCVLALMAFALAPCATTAAGLVAVATVRVMADAACTRMLRPTPLPWFALLAGPLRELLLGAAWLEGLLRRSVVWRGNRLRVGKGTVLLAPGSGQSGGRHSLPAPASLPDAA